MFFVNDGNDKGYSLVELITVISIMAIVVAAVSLSVSFIFSRDAEKAAVSIDDELAETRMFSMSKSGTITMVIHTDGSADPRNNTIEIMRNTSSYKVVKIDRSVSITLKDSTGETTPGDDIKIEFDKSSGRVVSVNDTPTPDNALYEIKVVSPKGGGKTVTVVLVGNTGKHYITK